MDGQIAGYAAVLCHFIGKRRELSVKLSLPFILRTVFQIIHPRPVDSPVLSLFRRSLEHGHKAGQFFVRGSHDRGL